jgi:uncharacterized membrane protein
VATTLEKAAHANECLGGFFYKYFRQSEVKTMEEYLKETIEKAEKYALLGLASAVIFFTLSWVQPQPGDIVEWKLLGFPINVEPQLALIASFLAYQFFMNVVYCFILHARDLTRSRNPETDDRGFKYPTLLTVSPQGSAATTLVAGLLVGFGCYKVYQYYLVNSTLMFILGGYSILVGLGVFLRNQEIIAYRKVSKEAQRVYPQSGHITD